MGSPKKGGNGQRGQSYSGSLIQERPEEIDFIDIYWRIQKTWSHDPRFNAENFGYQPLYLIYQAYDYAFILERERLHNQELPTAKLAWHYVTTHTEKEKLNNLDFNTFCFFKSDPNIPKISSYLANTIFGVLKDRKMPVWVFDSLPRREIFAQRKGVQQVYPRCWIDTEGKSVALFCPVFCLDSKIQIGAALLMDGISGVRCVRDVDTGEVFLVEIPHQEEPNLCIYELEIKLLSR